jgi:hypothetical protein
LHLTGPGFCLGHQIAIEFSFRLLPAELDHVFDAAGFSCLTLADRAIREAVNNRSHRTEGQPQEQQQITE